MTNATVSSFTAPKGTYDLTPPESSQFLAVREGMAAPLRRAGYGYVETPTFEDVALFARGVGESTDIVSKEMFTLSSRSGRETWALRPEGTASVLRAALESNLHRGALPVKLWYSGSFYRYERPQAGRYRHFSQVGAEVLGVEDPALDAELVTLAADSFSALGLRRARLLVNSLGCRECRPAYRGLLQDFLRGLDLDTDTRERVELNPLRVLDDKRPDVQAKLQGAPLISEHLCAACQVFHDRVRALLTANGVPYSDDPKLVRGLDYYTRTTFEFVHDGLGAQSAIGGGGRYDGLSELLGGPELPGVGWALGVDRTLLALRAEEAEPATSVGSDVFAVALGEDATTALFGVVTTLRRQGVAADMAYGGKGLKGAMKSADRSGARFTVVAGQRDLADGVAQLKDMASGAQQPVALDDLVSTVKEKLS